MKKNFVLQAVSITLTLAAGVLLCFRPGRIPAVILLAAAAAVGLIQLFSLRQQEKLFEFLKKESRKQQENDPVWNEEEKEKLRLIQKRVELLSLQNQINPHFLYNTLDSIRSRALLNGQKEIASMTEILSKFFRYCISQSDSLVRLSEEISHINDYYYIQKYRFEDRFDMTIHVEDESLYDDYLPKLTLQPLVENAMVHGLEKKAGKGLIEIRICSTAEHMIITVSDNGAGMSVEELERMNARMEGKLFDTRKKKENHTGIAVNNINTRIKLAFGSEYGIHYRSMQNIGTDVEVTIPLIDDFTRIHYENVLEDGT